jgi:hypothetical protein
MDNQDQVTKLQREWEQRRRLDARKDALAKHVYDLVNSQREALPDPAQLQNLRSLAASTDSLEELKIYIWYQMSRPGRPPIRLEFGRPLVRIIETLAQEEEELAVKQVRLLLGYLYRYARFARINPSVTSGGQRSSANRSGGSR